MMATIPGCGPVEWPARAGEPMGGQTPARLTDAERSQRLEAEIDRYVRAGFRVVARTPTTAQLVKPKTFNMGCALLGFLFLLAGLVLYLLYYVSKRDSSVYLSVDEFGVVHRQVSGDVPKLSPMYAAGGQAMAPAMRTGDTRLECANCGYENSPSRQSCKRCRRPLLS
jgi:hypothetical protein